jgi:hypothetical protein
MPLGLLVPLAAATLIILLWPLPFLVRRRRRLAALPPRAIVRAWGLAVIAPLGAWAVVASETRIRVSASTPGELALFGMTVAILMTVLLTIPLAVVTSTVLWHLERRRT